MLPCEFLHHPEGLLLQVGITYEISDLYGAVPSVGLERGNGLLIVEHHVGRTERESLSEYTTEVVNQIVRRRYHQISALAQSPETLQEVLPTPTDVLQVIDEETLDQGPVLLEFVHYVAYLLG